MKLGFFYIDLGTILFTLCNTLILFLGLKHFLFKPVQKILTERQAAVDQTLQDAEDARSRAEAAETEYTEKLAVAKEESAAMLRNATRKAQQRSDEIVAQAKAEAAGILQQNRDELDRERRRAESELRSEVSGLAVLVAEKVVEREINQADHVRLIDEFIDSVGDVQ
ncbi:MAG: F0F1 ATP synthase subunit B [Oscillospiraceae bacterium]|nr:F0F1 ATP synthase subunit B [Oscillospiraceae bacterium]